MSRKLVESVFEETVNEDIGVAEKTWKRMNKGNHIFKIIVSLVVESETENNQNT